MKLLIFSTLFLAFIVNAEENFNLYKNEIIGFEIQKPNKWSFKSKDKILKIKANPRMTDKQLEEEVIRYATTPIAVMTKHAKSSMDNPTVAVVYKPIAPLKGWEPDKILEIYANDVMEKIPGAVILAPPQNSNLVNVPAGYMKIKYPPNMGTVMKDSVIAETIVIPQGDYMYLVNMYSINEEPEFKRIVNSIKVNIP